MQSKKVDKKIKEALRISEEILSSLEDGGNLEEILSKCKKLARIRNDTDAIKWFTLELNGYDYKSLPQGIQSSEVFPLALFAGRGVQYTNPITKKNDQRFWQESVPSLETQITTARIALDKLRPPENYTPAITKTGDKGFLSGATFVQESYRDVLNALKAERVGLSSIINSKTTLLAKIRSRVYDYVSTTDLTEPILFVF